MYNTHKHQKQFFEEMVNQISPLLKKKEEEEKQPGLVHAGIVDLSV